MLSLDFCLEGRRSGKLGVALRSRRRLFLVSRTITGLNLYTFFLLTYSSLFVLHGIRHPPSLFEDAKCLSRSFKRIPKKDALNVINGSLHFKSTWTVADITLLLRTRVSSTEPSLVILRDWMYSPVVCQIFRQKHLKCDQWKTCCSPWAGH